MKSYIDSLPKDHLNNLYGKSLNTLLKGENVLISAIHGCGVNIFLNLFSKLIREEKIFDNIYLYDPSAEEADIIKFVKKIKKNNDHRNLVIIKSFEKLNEKKDILEKLHALRQPSPFNMVFIVFTDHTGVTNPENYLAHNTSFFNGRFYIGPMTLAETKEMNSINTKYFEWNINKSLDEEIYNLSGGVPRITKHICHEMWDNKISITNYDWFTHEPAINFQLSMLVQIVVKNNKHMLQKLGLVDDKGHIKSLLLQKYLLKYKSQFIKDIYANLSSLEAKILTFLYENKERIVTLDEIGDFLEINGHEFSLWAAYKLLSRLKVKIKNNFDLQNIKGEGYMLKLKNPQIAVG